MVLGERRFKTVLNNCCDTKNERSKIEAVIKVSAHTTRSVVSHEFPVETETTYIF